MKHIFKLILLFNFSFSFEVEDMNITNIYNLLNKNALEVEDMNIGNVYSIFNRNECEGFSQDECEYLDYCEWIVDSDNPNSWGMCVEVGNDDDGLPECLLDCEGLPYTGPDNPDELCDWIISINGTECMFDCE